MGSYLQLGLVQDWNMSGHNWAGVLVPISPPGIAIGGLQDGSKQPQNAINRAYVATSGFGGSKSATQGGSWLDQDRGHTR